MTFEELKQNCMGCQKCSLCELRTNVVFGDGVKTAKVIFVGEAPGKNEDEQGKPFVGRSGALLDVYLNSVGLSRKENIFITNIVKCRPPENRDPKPNEWKECLPHLESQIDVMKPKIIVCLGRIAAQRLIDKNYSVTKDHGKFTLINGIYYTATLHPAALLRNPNNKPLAQEDFYAIRSKIDEICKII